MLHCLSQQGSRHTHDPVGYWVRSTLPVASKSSWCLWFSFNLECLLQPVIDGCGNDCNGLGPPGSIMSYCHQCASISLGGVLTTFGGTCDSGDCSDINNWQKWGNLYLTAISLHLSYWLIFCLLEPILFSSPYNVGNNPKRVPHKMYGQMSGLGACVQP